MKPHAALPAVEDVHYQIFGYAKRPQHEQARRQRLKLDSHPTWNAILAVHRERGRSRPSRPEFTLHTTTLPLTNTNIGSWGRPSHPQLRVIITGHVRVGTLAATGKDTSPPLDAYMEEIMLKAGESVKNGNFADVNELLLAVRDALKQWLPRSSIATILELNDVEVVLWGGSNYGRRYVCNALFRSGDSNGSEHLASAKRAAVVGRDLYQQTWSRHGTIFVEAWGPNL